MIPRLKNYTFLFPVFGILLFLTIYPTIFLVYLSFTNYQLGKPETMKILIGIRNFISIFSNPYFRQSTLVTFIYTAVCVVCEMVLGIGIALLLAEPFFGQRLIRSILLLPMMMTPVAVGLVWKLMFNETYGIINYYLGHIGLTPGWLSSGTMALISTMIVDIWQWTPFVILIGLAGLYSLPVTPFEAARIDGASAWQLLVYITLPLLKPLLMIALLIRVMDCFKIFDNIYVLTRGGPGMATEVLSLSIYKTNFWYQQVGKAAAMSFVMLFIAIGISQVLIHLLRQERY